MARTKTIAVPEAGSEAPEFHLPSAQGGQLRLSMRTARGPVVVAFYEGPTDEEVAYFKELAAREDEMNMAAASVVGIGVAEPAEAREFVEKTGIKSYVLYDYASVAVREWGLLEKKSKERGAHARPATFIVDGDRMVAHAWVGERPDVADVLAKVSEISGLPKAPEEKPKKDAEGAEGKTGGADEKAGTEEGGGEKPKKMSAEERERIKAERRAAREAGKSLKTGQPERKDGGEGAESGDAPKREKPSPEERERRRAERRAARENDEQKPESDAASKAGTAEVAEEAPGAQREEETESRAEGKKDAGTAKEE